MGSPSVFFFFSGLQEIVQQLLLFSSPDNAQHAQVLEVRPPRVPVVNTRYTVPYTV